MRKTWLSGALIAALGLAAVADSASAYPHHARYYRHCHYQKHRNGAIGAVSGAVGGGIIGGAMTHGSGPAVLLGAGAGALAGNALARHSTRC
jgi:outer membrane lipoprotein SlyB